MRSAIRELHPSKTPRRSPQVFKNQLPRNSQLIPAIRGTAMYEKAFKKLGGYLAQNKLSLSGRPAVLYFMWDEGNKKAEIGIAVPVTGLKSIDDPELTLVNVPPTKAALAVLLGTT